MSKKNVPENNQFRFANSLKYDGLFKTNYRFKMRILLSEMHFLKHKVACGILT